MFYGNGNPMNGYSYGVARPQARNTQPLTPDQISKLRQDTNGFDMKVSQEDLWRAACTHKEKNGQGTLIQNNDGTYTCTICHETFNLTDYTHEEVENAAKVMIDVLQTIKTTYLDAPDELILQYMQIIPLIKKMPALWDRSIKNFGMYENTLNGNVNQMGPGYSGFNAMFNLMNNPYGGFGFNPNMGAQPQYYGAPNSAPQQAPMGYPQAPQYPNPGFGMNGMPMQQPFAAAPGMDPNNPMAYGAPIPTPTAPQAPAAPAVGAMPGVPQPAPAPVNPAPKQAEVQQQQVFNV